MYCSDECANHDAFHKESCPSKVAQHVEIAQKLIVKALKIVGDCDTMYELLMNDMKKTVFDFDLSNPDDPMHKKNLLIAVNSLSTEVEVEGLNSAEIHPKYTERETECALKYLLIWATNGYYMQENTHAILGSRADKYEFGEIIGSGMFPFLSLLNHSCCPNVKNITVDNKFVLVVSRPIKAGEQIFVYYGNSYFQDARDERRQKLARYKFNCDCIACIEDYPKLKNYPKIDRQCFKEPDFGVFSTEAAIKQFKINCEYIEQNIKTNPTYEVEHLILHNYHLLQEAAKINFDDDGIEYS